jgi:hypothetical protein
MLMSERERFCLNDDIFDDLKVFSLFYPCSDGNMYCLDGSIIGQRLQTCRSEIFGSSMTKQQSSSAEDVGLFLRTGGRNGG